MSCFGLGPYAGAKTCINCAINCTLLKAVPNVQHFLNVVKHDWNTRCWTWH